jgi:hypothetical protein
MVRRTALVGGGAAGGGALAWPTATRTQGDTAAGTPAYQRLERSTGAHQLGLSTVAPAQRVTGVRARNKAYTAALSQHIDHSGWPTGKPVKVSVYDDKALVDNGNHRLWAAHMAGRRRVPVEVARVPGKSPRRSRAVSLANRPRANAQWSSSKEFAAMNPRARAAERGRLAAAAPKPGSAGSRFNRYVADSGEKQADKRRAMAKAAWVAVVSKDAPPTLRDKIRSGAGEARAQALYGVSRSTVPKLSSEERSRRALQNTYGLSAPGVHKVPAAAAVVGGVTGGQALGQLAGKAIAAPLRRKGLRGAKIPGHVLGGIGSTIGGAAGARFATAGREKAYSGAERRLRAHAGL